MRTVSIVSLMFILVGCEGRDLRTFDGGDTHTPAGAAAVPASGLQGIVSQWQQQSGVLGASVAVRVKGQDVQLAAAGLTAPSQAAIAPNAAFQIGSVTKVMTATLVLQAVEEGRLKLDDPLSKWLPDAPHAAQITVRHLLNHTSGVPDYLAALFQSSATTPDAQPQSVLQILDLAYKSTANAPGGPHAYSNTNYIMLGGILEAVRGESFAKQLHERILEPAGMTRTFLNSGTDQALSPFTDGFEKEGNAFKTALHVHGDWAWAAGAVVSTPEDLTKFFSQLGTHQLVTQASVESMTTGVPIPGTDLQYGLGLMLQSTSAGTFIGHLGKINGIETILGYLVELDTHIAAYATSSPADFSTLVPQIAALAQSAAGVTPAGTRGPSP